MGTTKPVYMSSILTGTSQPGIRGTANTPVSCTYTEIHAKRLIYTCILDSEDDVVFNAFDRIFLMQEEMTNSSKVRYNKE